MLRPGTQPPGSHLSVQIISARLMSMWDVEYTSQFDDWYQTLTEEDQDAVIARVELLKSAGPGLAAPPSTTFTVPVIRT